MKNYKIYIVGEGKTCDSEEESESRFWEVKLH